MQKVLFKGVKQFTSDAWELVKNSEDVKQYLNLVRKVDDQGQVIEGEAQVWFGSRLYADLGGERVETLETIVNNIINAIGTDTGGTINYNNTTYVTCATTVNEAIEMLDSAITQNAVVAGQGISVTPHATGTTVSVKLADDEQVLSFLPDGELHGEVRIKKIDAPDDDHFAAQYQLVDKDDNPIANSQTIDIIKDQFLKRVLLTEDFETQEQIDQWCAEHNIPDYAKAQMFVDNSYLVFEWELDLGPDAHDVDAETYTVVPVKMLLSTIDLVINGVTGTTESGVTTIELVAEDIPTGRDALYLESVDDEGVETYKVGVAEGTDVTTGFEDVLKLSLLYIEGNDVE